MQLKRMQLFTARVLLCLLLALPQMVGAAPAADLSDEWRSSRDLYLFSTICRAAYTDQRAEGLVELLRVNGWTVETYFQPGVQADAKFFAASRQADAEEPALFLVAIAGTESKKDIQVDLTFDKTPFAALFGDAPPEGTDMQEWLVHKGFLRYVKTALAVQPEGRPPLAELLRTHPEQKVYLVGHSLGGAVATLGGAVLLTEGVSPEQVEVVTFGAPPVGNQAFANAFGSRLHLTRITMQGDPVPDSLINLVGGYRQFGREIKWDMPGEIDKSPHAIAVYSDVAMKRYFDAKKNAEVAALLPTDKGKVADGQPLVYLAPLTGQLPDNWQHELPYMQAAATDLASRKLPGYIVGTKTGDLAEMLQCAGQQGAEAVLMTEVQAERMRQEKDTYYVTVLQRVYRVSDARLVHYSVMSSNTKELTALEAFARAQADELALSNQWLSKCGRQQ